MADGRIYVGVSGTVADGNIMPLNSSTGGIHMPGYLYWPYAKGFKDRGWFYGEGTLGNDLGNWWASEFSRHQKEDGTPYTNSDTDFKDFMVNGGQERPGSLDSILTGWNALDASDRARFIGEKGLYDCLDSYEQT